MRNAAFIVVVLFADIWGSRAQGPWAHPKCAEITCPEGETCGVLSHCEDVGCYFEAVCLAQGEWSYGCPWGQALVEPYTGGSVVRNHPLIPPGTPLNVENQPPPPYEMVSCGSRKQCPGGFFCSARMADASSRCCPSRAGTGPKPGSCPAIASFKDSIYFCVDQCLNDDDCDGDQKCCVTAEECSRKECKPPV